MASPSPSSSPPPTPLSPQAVDQQSWAWEPLLSCRKKVFGLDPAPVATELLAATAGEPADPVALPSLVLAAGCTDSEAFQHLLPLSELSSVGVALSEGSSTTLLHVILESPLKCGHTSLISDPVTSSLQPDGTCSSSSPLDVVDVRPSTARPEQVERDGEPVKQDDPVGQVTTPHLEEVVGEGHRDSDKADQSSLACLRALWVYDQ